MKLHLSLLLAVAALVVGAYAQGIPAIPPPDKDPFVGTWKANRDKSQPKLDGTEASYTRTVSREGDDLVFSSRIKNPHGFANNYRIRCDGQFHSVPFGQVSCEYKTAGLVEGETKSPDGKDGFWAREVTANGDELRVYAYKDKARKRLQSVEVMDRVQ